MKSVSGALFLLLQPRQETITAKYTYYQPWARKTGEALPSNSSPPCLLPKTHLPRARAHPTPRTYRLDLSKPFLVPKSPKTSTMTVGLRHNVAGRVAIRSDYGGIAPESAFGSLWVLLMLPFCAQRRIRSESCVLEGLRQHLRAPG